MNTLKANILFITILGIMAILAKASSQHSNATTRKTKKEEKSTIGNEMQPYEDNNSTTFISKSLRNEQTLNETYLQKKQLRINRKKKRKQIKNFEQANKTKMIEEQERGTIEVSTILEKLEIENVRADEETSPVLSDSKPTNNETLERIEAKKIRPYSKAHSPTYGDSFLNNVETTTRQILKQFETDNGTHQPTLRSVISFDTIPNGFEIPTTETLGQVETESSRVNITEISTTSLSLLSNISIITSNKALDETSKHKFVNNLGTSVDYGITETSSTRIASPFNKFEIKGIEKIVKLQTENESEITQTDDLLSTTFETTISEKFRSSKSQNVFNHTKVMSTQDVEVFPNTIQVSISKVEVTDSQPEGSQKAKAIFKKKLKLRRKKIIKPFKNSTINKSEKSITEHPISIAYPTQTKNILTSIIPINDRKILKSHKKASNNNMADTLCVYTYAERKTNKTKNIPKRKVLELIPDLTNNGLSLRKKMLQRKRNYAHFNNTNKTILKTSKYFKNEQNITDLDKELVNRTRKMNVLQQLKKVNTTGNEMQISLRRIKYENGTRDELMQKKVGKNVLKQTNKFAKASGDGELTENTYTVQVGIQHSQQASQSNAVINASETTEPTTELLLLLTNIDLMSTETYKSEPDISFAETLTVPKDTRNSDIVNMTDKWLESRATSEKQLNSTSNQKLKPYDNVTSETLPITQETLVRQDELMKHEKISMLNSKKVLKINEMKSGESHVIIEETTENNQAYAPISIDNATTAMEKLEQIKEETQTKKSTNSSINFSEINRIVKPTLLDSSKELQKVITSKDINMQPSSSTTIPGDIQTSNKSHTTEINHTMSTVLRENINIKKENNIRVVNMLPTRHGNSSENIQKKKISALHVSENVEPTTLSTFHETNDIMEGKKKIKVGTKTTNYKTRSQDQQNTSRAPETVHEIRRNNMTRKRRKKKVQGTRSNSTEIRWKKNQYSNTSLGTRSPITSTNRSKASVNASNVCIFDRESMKYLNLSFRFLRYPYRNKLINYTSLIKLDISHNKIFRFNISLLNNLESLKIINLDFNNITDLFPQYFHVLKNLEILNLSHNTISRIRNHTFVNLSALKYLNLSFNNLTQINLTMFEGLRVLTKLEVSNNKIDNINSNFLAYLPLLKEINLSNNRISNPYIFNLINIQIVELSFNQIKSINNITNGNLTSQIKILKINNNLIAHINENIFKRMSTLIYLDIANNKLNSILPSTFQYLYNLIYLNVSCQKILQNTNNNRGKSYYIDANDQLEKNTTENMKTMRYSLQQNNQTVHSQLKTNEIFIQKSNNKDKKNRKKERNTTMTREYKVDTNFTKMKKYKKRNKIVKLDTKNPRELITRQKKQGNREVNNENLDIKERNDSLSERRKYLKKTEQPFDNIKQKLTNFINEPIAELTADIIDFKLNVLTSISQKLKQFECINIHLKQIPKVLTHSIQILNLKSNKIKAIQLGDFDDYPLLQILILSQNKINVIENDSLGRLDYLKILLLNNNKLKIIPVSLPETIEILNLNANLITKIDRTDFIDMIRLQKLYLAFNKITSICSTTFAHLDRLTHLDISNNPIKVLNNLLFKKISFIDLSNLQHIHINVSSRFPLEDGNSLVGMNLVNSSILCNALVNDYAFTLTLKQIKYLNCNEKTTLETNIETTENNSSQRLNFARSSTNFPRVTYKNTTAIQYTDSCKNNLCKSFNSTKWNQKNKDLGHNFESSDSSNVNGQSKSFNVKRKFKSNTMQIKTVTPPKRNLIENVSHTNKTENFTQINYTRSNKRGQIKTNSSTDRSLNNIDGATLTTINANHVNIKLVNNCTMCKVNKTYEPLFVFNINDVYNLSGKIVSFENTTSVHVHSLYEIELQKQDFEHCLRGKNRTSDERNKLFDENFNRETPSTTTSGSLINEYFNLMNILRDMSFRNKSRTQLSPNKRKPKGNQIFKAHKTENDGVSIIKEDFPETSKTNKPFDSKEWIKQLFAGKKDFNSKNNQIKNEFYLNDEMNVELNDQPGTIKPDIENITSNLTRRKENHFVDEHWGEENKFSIVKDNKENIVILKLNKNINKTDGENYDQLNVTNHLGLFQTKKQENHKQSKSNSIKNNHKNFTHVKSSSQPKQMETLTDEMKTEIVNNFYRQVSKSRNEEAFNRSTFHVTDVHKKDRVAKVLNNSNVNAEKKLMKNSSHKFEQDESLNKTYGNKKVYVNNFKKKEYEKFINEKNSEQNFQIKNIHKHENRSNELNGTQNNKFNIKATSLDNKRNDKTIENTLQKNKIIPLHKDVNYEMNIVDTDAEFLDIVDDNTEKLDENSIRTLETSKFHELISQNAEEAAQYHTGVILFLVIVVAMIVVAFLTLTVRWNNVLHHYCSQYVSYRNEEDDYEEDESDTHLDRMEMMSHADVYSIT